MAVGVTVGVGVAVGALVEVHPEVSFRFMKPPLALSHCTQPQKLPAIEQLVLLW